MKKENRLKKKLKTVNQLKAIFEAAKSVSIIARIFSKKQNVPHEYIFRLALKELDKGVDADLKYIEKLITDFTELHKSMTEPTDFPIGGIVAKGEEVIVKPIKNYIPGHRCPPPPPPARTICGEIPVMGSKPILKRLKKLEKFIKKNSF